MANLMGALFLSFPPFFCNCQQQDYARRNRANCVSLLSKCLFPEFAELTVDRAQGLLLSRRRKAAQG